MCPGDTVTCTCRTGNSNTLVWMTDGSRLEFASNDPLMTRRDVNSSSTFAVIAENSDRNGVRVIVSNLTFITPKSMSSVVMCENVDRSSTESVFIPVSGKIRVFQTL